MKLLLLLEGDDDQRFIERVVLPLLGPKYDHIKLMKYASSSPKETCKLIKTFQAAGWNYIFLADRDSHPCFTSKRDSVSAKWTAVDRNLVVVVDCEIESWYIGGVTNETAMDLGFTLPRRLEAFTKEHLLRCVNNRNPTATDIKLKLLEAYSLDLAKRNLPAFSYLCRRLGI